MRGHRPAWQNKRLREAHTAIWRLKNTEHLLTESFEKSRHLSHELTLPVLHHADLSTAVEWLTRRMEEWFGLKVNLKTKAFQEVKNPLLKVFLFRAIQELLFNTAKHAGVDHAQVLLSQNDDNLIISMSDLGNGFIPEELFQSGNIGLGLSRLKERIWSIGGESGH